MSIKLNFGKLSIVYGLSEFYVYDQAWKPYISEHTYQELKWKIIQKTNFKT